MVHINRRNFISHAAMAAAAAGLDVMGYRPLAAQAQFTTFLSYLVSANPILAAVYLFELGTKPSAPTIADVISSVDGLAQSLKNSFEDLQRHFRSMLVASLDEFALKQDTYELAALAYRVNIAVAGGSRESEVRNLSGDIDGIALKLGLRGVAGSLMYLNAIALQNSVHKMLGSQPQVILAVNKPHEQALGRIIYDGTRLDTLEHAIVQKRIEMNATPYYKNLQFLKDRLGDWYQLGVVTRFYESGVVSTCDFIFRYDGFQGGELIGSRGYGQETFPPTANNAYRGRLIKATYTPNGKSDVYPLSVRLDGRLAFPETWPCAQVMVGQINSIVDGYKQFYNANYGPEISSRTVTDFYLTKEHEALRNYLVTTGLNSVKKIISLASAQAV